MIEHCLALQKALSFFEKKSYRFQEAVCIVFGTEARDIGDFVVLSQDFSAIKWEKVNNGRVLYRKEIYAVRGISTLISETKSSKHHWPPSSRGGELTIKVPDQFHRAWHDIFMNLFTKEEFEIFWQMMSSIEDVALRDVVDCTRKKAKIKTSKKKK